MSYQTALELAGAKILAYESFGSYQGDAWFKILYQGKQGWLCISYGSCSGCDSFESTFGYTSHEHSDGSYVSASSNTFDVSCPECSDLVSRLADFGSGYMGAILTQEQAEERAKEHAGWDMEAQKVLEFLQKNSLDLEIDIHFRIN